MNNKLDLLSYDPEREIRLSSLGFVEDPFSTAADPRFLYLSPQHNEVLEKTQRLILDRRGLAVIEGPIGIGKSTVARRLEGVLRMYPDNFHVMFFNSASFKTENEFLIDMCNLCNLPKRKGQTMQWRELEGYMVKLAKQNKNVVLILDDVERMNPNALDAIHHLYNFDVLKKVVQTILVGQSEGKLQVRRVFDKKDEVRNRVYSWFTLHPLSVKDAFNLINFRCNVAGRTEPFLSQSGFVKVWKVCGGIPRNLVILCSVIVDIASSMEKKIIDDEIIDEAIRQYKGDNLQLELGLGIEGEEETEEELEETEAGKKDGA
jgi:general secretion pathway protein A